jgi:hypothetical protein
MTVGGKMKRIYIGIDPGLSGAIVGLDPDGKLLFFSDTPVIGESRKRKINLQELVRLLSSELEKHSEKEDGVWDALCTIESVHSMPGQGVSSSFKFGQSLGCAEGVLQALGIPWQSVTPIRWKRALMTGAGPFKEKSTSVLVASRIWQNLPMPRKMDHNRAEAALLAEYGRKIDETAHRWGVNAQEISNGSISS